MPEQVREACTRLFGAHEEMDECVLEYIIVMLEDTVDEPLDVKRDVLRDFLLSTHFSDSDEAAFAVCDKLFEELELKYEQPVETELWKEPKLLDKSFQFADGDDVFKGDTSGLGGKLVDINDAVDDRKKRKKQQEEEKRIAEEKALTQRRK